MENPSDVTIGSTVTYVDEVGTRHNALVTQVWSPPEAPGVNLIYISGRSDETDQYGRQIKRASSTQHQSRVGETPGCYWA